MRFKKPLIIAIIVVIVCAGIFLFLKGEKCRYVKRVTGFDISSCKILKSEDTHGGFLGDGEYILIADCGKDPHWPADLDGWKELPLPENIQLIMYGPEPDEYDYSLAGEAGIPYIETGIIISKTGILTLKKRTAARTFSICFHSIFLWRYMMRTRICFIIMILTHKSGRSNPLFFILQN